MARVKNGLISGALGELVYYVRNGEQFVRRRPDRRRLETKVEELHRNYFGMCSALGASVMELQVLKNAWDNPDLKGDYPFSRFVTVNMPIILHEGGISKVKLVESPMLWLTELRGCIIDSEGILTVLGINNFPRGASWVSAQIIFDAMQEDEDLKTTCSFFSLTGPPKEIAEEVTFEYRYDPYEKEFIRTCTGKSLLLNLAYWDSCQNEVLGFSETKFFEEE
jgi:hypothetical protein